MPRIIDVVEFIDESGREIVHRIPERGSGDFRLGSQVIVREQQAAVFFRDGKAMDVFDAGRHTITTANMPILSGLIGLATSGKTPFTAEVYYVSMRQFLDMGWGTPEPVTMRDADLGMVRLRANGVYTFEIKDPSLFVNKIVGTQGIYETPQIENMLRGIIISKFSDLLGEVKIPFLDLPAKYDELRRGYQSQGDGRIRPVRYRAEIVVHPIDQPDRRDCQGHRRALADGRDWRHEQIYAIPGRARYPRCCAESKRWRGWRGCWPGCRAGHGPDDGGCFRAVDAAATSAATRSADWRRNTGCADGRRFGP